MRSIIPFNANTNSLFRGWFLTFQDAKSRTMQFEWWRKREKENRQSGSFEIRHRTRGGPVRSLHFCFGMVLSGADGGLFREFRPASRNNLHFHFPIDEKRRNWNGIWSSRVFLSRFILFAFRLWIFLLDTVYIAPIDRPCLAISLLLRFPFCGFLLNLPLHSSFHYCFLSFFFFFRFAIESFLRSFLIFFPIRSSLPLSITRKKKNTMERDFIRRYLKKAIFR